MTGPDVQERVAAEFYTLSFLERRYPDSSVLSVLDSQAASSPSIDMSSRDRKNRHEDIVRYVSARASVIASLCACVACQCQCQCQCQCRCRCLLPGESGTAKRLYGARMTRSTRATQAHNK